MTEKMKIFREFVETESKKSTPVLDKIGRDLTEYAREGKLEPVIGREKEIKQIIWILSRKNKNNPVIIGEPGVGKTAIVEGLAQLIVSQNCPESIADKRIIYIDMGTINAGGGLEEKTKIILNELRENPDVILFIDEIHMIVDSNKPIDFANLIKPALANGEMRCIGSTTNNEFRNSIEKDGALERRFQKVMVEQTSVEDTIEILNKIKHRYEDFHKVKYDNGAIEACAKLADRYVTHRFFPDKAIDLLDEVGANTRITKRSTPKEVVDAMKELKEVKDKKNKMLNQNDYDAASKYRTKEKELIESIMKMKKKYSDEVRIDITADDVAQVVSLKTGIPIDKMSEDDTSKLLNLERDLKMDIIGQDEAVKKISKCIRRNRAGLKDPKRPMGVFLFLGSTGVGKTHTVKTLAKHLFQSESDMIRIDMSEYAEKHNVSRMIGSPPGYVGYGEGGQLTEKVRRKPYCIILFDELEKAHPEVLNIMLQIFDEGQLTDGQGRKVDFRNTVIVMTSNIGTRAIKDIDKSIDARIPVGFNIGKQDQESQQSAKIQDIAKDRIKTELNNSLPPEFINRIDDIIIFASLSKENIYRIIDNEISIISNRLKEKGFTLEITDNVKDLLIEKGYDSKMGARPLKRAIQTYLEDPISDEILKKTVKDIIKVDYDKQAGKVSINGILVEESKKYLVTKFDQYRLK